MRVCALSSPRICTQPTRSAPVSPRPSTSICHQIKCQVRRLRHFSPASFHVHYRGLFSSHSCLNARLVDDEGLRLAFCNASVKKKQKKKKRSGPCGGFRTAEHYQSLVWRERPVLQAEFIFTDFFPAGSYCSEALCITFNKCQLI